MDSNCSTSSADSDYTYKPLSQCCSDSAFESSSQYICSDSVAYLNSYGTSTSCAGSPTTTSQSCVASSDPEDLRKGAFYSITCNPAVSSGLSNISTNYLTFQSGSSETSALIPWELVKKIRSAQLLTH